MTRAQKKTVTWISLAAIGLLCAAVVVLAILAATNRLIGDRPMGEVFLALSANFTALGTMLKVLSALVLTGIGILGTKHRSVKSISVTTAMLAVGIIACIVLLIAVGNAEIAANLWGPSRIGGTQSFEELQAAARPMIIWTGGALSTTLAAYLGISFVKGTSNG